MMVANEQERRMCCCIIGGIQCDASADVEIHSKSGDTLSCARHVYDLLEDGENRIYPLSKSTLSAMRV